ncbi:MAG: hypothetical protein ACI915_003827 [Gammaproteobacteria bacterium]|jgi:hypothetical protein
MRNLYLIAAIFGLYTTSCIAEVVYDEAVDGDLPGFEQFFTPGAIFAVFDFDPGSNTIAGTTPWRFDSSDPSDAIQFIVTTNETLQISVDEAIIGNDLNGKVA